MHEPPHKALPQTGRAAEIAFKFQGNFASIRHILAQIRQKLIAHGIAMDVIGSAEIAFAEILNNVVEHAYQESGEGEIALHISLGPNAIELTVVDTGIPISGALPSQREALRQNTAIEDLPEGGFGWSLIRMLVDELHYQSDGHQNQLRCHISRTPRDSS